MKKRDMVDYAKHVRDLLGLHDYEITLKKKRIERDSDDGDSNTITGGKAHIDSRYLHALITINSAVQDQAQIEQTIIHEMLEVALAEIGIFVERLLVRYTFDETERDFLQALYTDAKERTIQRLARGLHQSIKPSILIEEKEKSPFLGNLKGGYGCV